MGNHYIHNGEGKKKKTRPTSTGQTETKDESLSHFILHNLRGSLNQMQSCSYSTAKGTIRYTITVCKFLCCLPLAGKASSHT